jgi:hypothetical protein
VQRVHLIEFPTKRGIQMLEDGKPSTNSEWFNDFLSNGVIDSYINSNKRMVNGKVSLEDYTCPKDGHFCRKGNQWLAQSILQHIDWSDSAIEK